MGKGNIRPHTESTPLNRSSKNLSQVITSATPTAVLNLVYSRPRWSSGRMGEIWPTFFYLYPFFGNSPTGQTRRRIFAHDGSNDADSRKDVPFRGFVDSALHLGGKIPQNPNFWGVYRGIQAKLANLKTCILLKLPHRFHSNQMADFRFMFNGGRVSFFGEIIVIYYCITSI